MERYGLLYSLSLYLGTFAGAVIYFLHSKPMQETASKYLNEYPEIGIISLLAVIFGSIPFFKFSQNFEQAVGKLGDRLRVRKMSDYVADYNFGTNALGKLKEDLHQLERERAITELFNSGKNTSPKEFHESALRFLGKHSTR